MNLFTSAGYLKGSLVASSNAVVFSYVLYLIGKYEYKVSSVELQKIICKWIFMSTITGFYTGSTETEVEKQFADLRSIHTANQFVTYLDNEISNRFTDDYFRYSLPAELNSSSATSPAWYTLPQLMFWEHQCFSVLPLCRNILCSVQTEIKTL